MQMADKLDDDTGENDDFEDIVRRYGIGSDAAQALRALLVPRVSSPVPPDRSLCRPGLTLAPESEPGATFSGEGINEQSGASVTSGRYADLGIIGRGGMAEVRRVQDRQLGRNLAMKIIDAELMRFPTVHARFLDEARTTAQLEHPGIVPVHELGTTEDGRTFFTMQEVRGRTLSQVIRAVHGASTPDAWGATEDGWSLARVVDAFRRTCEAAAHAHARGVLHRDLKPDNVMVGPFGEVLVLDWGLARVTPGATTGGGDEPSTDSGARDPRRTRPGTVAGTPLYMPPEQAAGAFAELGPQADVYSLGIVLYEALYGTPPFAGMPTPQVLERVQRGAIDLPDDALPVPSELVELWRAATALDPAERPADAGELAERVRSWQEGAQQRERALSIVAEARTLFPRVGELRRQAVACLAQAATLRDTFKPWDPIERKRSCWLLEDEAEALAARAEQEELRGAERLRAALAEDPGLPEARRALADLYQARHAEAEAARDTRGAARWEVLLRAHDDGRHAAWLRGEGRLSLITDPPADADLYRMVREDRRLVPVLERSLGRTPLHAVRLPAGSWLVVLRAEGCADVRYPVHVERRDHWDAVPPDDTYTAAVPLPAAGSLRDDEIYVPAGWFSAGGDRDAVGSGPREHVWLDGFIMQRDPVTNRQYIEFLNALVAQGKGDQAVTLAPQERQAGGDVGSLVYGRGADGRFALRPDADGDSWGPEWPVFLVDEPGALAYAAWRSEREGVTWRLPWELEWEKAARGVDGRLHPWGDAVDPTWARLRESRPGRHLPADIDVHPGDVSPYGVRGLAGNVMDRCADAFTQGGAPVQGGRPVWGPAGDAPRTARGGAWPFSTMMARACVRAPMLSSQRRETLGFRLARDYRVR
jgi:eukaryotic-like serine/threonine-protein kinase